MNVEQGQPTVVPKETDFENREAYATAYLSYLIELYPDRLQLHSAEAEKVYSSIVLDRWNLTSRDGD